MIGHHRLRAIGERILADRGSAHDRSCLACLPHALVGDRRMKRRRQHASCRRVLEPVEHFACDAKRRRHDPARVSGVDPFGQHVHRERSAGEAAQRRRRPQPFVVAAARIEPDDEVDAPHARREQLEIRRQVVASALLARLDHADAARVRHAVRLQATDRGKRGKHRVAIVGAAAPVELAVLDQRLPGTEALAPSRHLGLLVEMPVKQHRPIARAGDIEEEQRRAARQAHDLQRESAHGLPTHPGFGEADCALDMAVRFPLRIEMRRLCRNADVLDELRDDRFGPVG